MRQSYPPEFGSGIGKIPVAPAYLADFAAQVKARTGLVTRAVGMIYDPAVAERIVASGQADCVAVGRAMLFDPRWALKAAHRFGAKLNFPNQYLLSSPQVWKGASFSVQT